MATVTLGMGSGDTAFNAVITVNDTSLVMSNVNNITNIKVTDGNNVDHQFNPVRALSFEGGSEGDANYVAYVTFRNDPNDDQFPIASGGGHISDQTGQSLDVWSDQFHDDVESSNSNENTWAKLESNYDANSSRFALNPNKWTVFYDYDNLNAPGYNKGGYMTVTISQ